jgi:hypothetical protein
VLEYRSVRLRIRRWWEAAYSRCDIALNEPAPSVPGSTTLQCCCIGSVVYHGFFYLATQRSASFVEEATYANRYRSELIQERRSLYRTSSTRTCCEPVIMEQHYNAMRRTWTLQILNDIQRWSLTIYSQGPRRPYPRRDHASLICESHFPLQVDPMWYTTPAWPPRHQSVTKSQSHSWPIPVGVNMVQEVLLKGAEENIEPQGL